MKIGDRVRPTSTCRSLYGDPDYLTIVEIKDGKYLTSIYTIWFDEHELTLA